MAATGGPPLAGVRVVELGNIIGGPYAGMLLADMGADVVKVEPPGGDLARGFGPFVDGVSYYFAAINRGKRSLAVDPRSPLAAPFLRRLCVTADVVLHNLRHGAMERMGLGYDDLLAENPRLVYTEVSAFGSTGPDKARAGIDILFQGESGMMSITGDEGGPPAKTATTVGDYLAGTNAALAVCAALFRRQSTGEGGRVDISLRDGLVAIQSSWNAMFFADGLQPARVGTGSWFTAPTATFATSDGHLNLAIVSDRHFEILCDELGLDLAERPEYATNELRVQHRSELEAAVSDALAGDTTEAWLERMHARGLPAGRILDLPEVFEDPQVRHNRMRVELAHPQRGPIPVTGSPVQVDREPAVAGRPPPELGEHTREVLREIGAADAEIEELIAQGAAVAD